MKSSVAVFKNREVVYSLSRITENLVLHVPAGDQFCKVSHQHTIFGHICLITGRAWFYNQR